MMEKSPDAFRTISEVGTDLDLPQHVLRFWETRFTQIRPLKRSGGRRYYRPEDIELLKAIRQLLYGQGYTIKGVQRMLKERGVKALVAQVIEGGVGPAPLDDEPDEAHSHPEPATGFERVDEPNVRANLSFEDIHRLKAALFELNEGIRVLKDSLSADD